MIAREPVLLVAPETPFDIIERTLGQLGWRQHPDPTAPEPILPGEPELVSFSDDEGARLIYAFEPATRLRSLRFTGQGAGRRHDRAAAALPTLALAALPSLLRAAEPERAILGIHAAVELDAVHLIADLGPLARSDDETIAREAALGIDALAASAAELGLEWLREQRARHPGRSILFRTLADPADRREILRHLMHENAPAGEPVLEVLRSALDDPDWEVRATAILAAARLAAKPVRSLVNKAGIPRAGEHGLDRVDHQILLSLRVAAVAMLDGRLEETHLSDEAARAYPAHAHVARCVRGDEVEKHDRVFHWVRRLTTPRESATPAS